MSMTNDMPLYVPLYLLHVQYYINIVCEIGLCDPGYTFSMHCIIVVMLSENFHCDIAHLFVIPYSGPLPASYQY